jgi:hypothetical protein
MMRQLRTLRPMWTDRQLRLAERPGDGIHGIVYVIESKGEPGKAALKVHYSKEPYLRERDNW